MRKGKAPAVECVDTLVSLQAKCVGKIILYFEEYLIKDYFEDLSYVFASLYLFMQFYMSALLLKIYERMLNLCTREADL